MRLELLLDGTHADTSDLDNDLAILYRYVAERFAVLLDGKVLYDEIDFPVVELAAALVRWRGEWFPARCAFSFTPSGADEVALKFAPCDDTWLVSSDSTPVIAVDADDVRRACDQFVSAVIRAGERADVDVSGVLSRLASHR